jgi:3-deoxy-D-manno-octulosonate 8-phosphate phosphatase (KDO 8-P phosphatase)
MSADEQIDIRCLVLDVDGVLTDGGIYTDDAGQGLRRFHVHDGFALRWFQRLGGTIILCSGKNSPAVDARARELGITRVTQGSVDKFADVQAHLDELGLTMDHVAMVGDDLPDLPVLARCAFPIAVANAADEVKMIARLVTTRAGGRGAVSEAVEYLLKAANRWDAIVGHYLPERDDPDQHNPLDENVAG